MEIIGSLFLILALAVVVAVFIGQPFLQKSASAQRMVNGSSAAVQEREHRMSSLLAERDRVLTALQELDFDYALGKVPSEDYPQQRAVLLKTGAEVLRNLDEMEEDEQSRASGLPARGAGSATQSAAGGAEDRIEAAVAARRADTSAAGTNGNGKGKDELEEIIARRKRDRKESAAGFCPHCGKPAQKSDKFCSKCGATL
jgi:hypothetical protein